MALKNHHLISMLLYVTSSGVAPECGKVNMTSRKGNWKGREPNAPWELHCT